MSNSKPQGKNKSYSKLRGKIREKYGTQEPFAEDMGMHPSTLSGRLSKKTDFTAPEIEKACELLELTYADIPEYFFYPMMCKVAQIPEA